MSGNDEQLASGSGAAGADGDEEMGEEYEWLQQQLRQLEGQGITLEQLQEAMLDAGGGWEDPTDGCLTQLITAVTDGDMAEMKKVLEANPDLDVNLPGPDGDTALHLAALYGHDEAVTALLARGAQAGCLNQDDGSTPAHDAAASGYLEILKVLLEKDPASVSVADEDGDTPLHNAARGNHTALVAALLQAGADPAAVNHEGHTPGQEADEEDVVKMLEAAVAAKQQS